MILTRKKALKLHQGMWKEMKNALGDNPPSDERSRFKAWSCVILRERPVNNCWLCEYVSENYGANRHSGTGLHCQYCPVVWGKGDEKQECPCQQSSTNWMYSSISEILALPERRTDE